MADDAMLSVGVGARVLVYGKYAGVIRYVPSRRSAWIGVELDRAVGDNDGELEGERHFQCKPHHGVFVREEQLQRFSAEDAAACVVQSAWRRSRAVQKFRRLVFSHAWNVLDNNQEQLNLKRSEKFKSAEHTLSMLSKKKSSSILQRTQSELALANIQIGPDYRGPHLTWPLRLANVLDMLEDFKKGVLLHYKYVLEILKESIRSLAVLPTLQEINLVEGEKITVVGDLHGQLQDLFSIFSINGLPSATNKYLFNGDFVDRGIYGVEVVMTLLSFRLLYPNSVYLNRGNHESRNQNSWMGFEDEIWSKYSGVEDDDPERPVQLFERFQTLFESLPLCAVLQSKIFVVHGGLFSRDNVTLAHLKKISRKREPPLHQEGFEDKIYEDMLWSDPRSIASRQPSERGAGVEFGVDVTNNFCLVNKIALIIRSHECVPEGFEILHGGRLITLFSASRYCGTQMNKGAFLTLGPDLQPEIQQFYAHAINESMFKAPEVAELQGALEDDTLRMIAERICDNKASLFWYFTQHDQEHNGTVPRLVWAEALKSVLQLDLPFLTYQPRLANMNEDTGTINYSRFLARYRIENDAMDNTGWQESIISLICKKLYRAMGAGNIEQAFKVFDTERLFSHFAFVLGNAIVLIATEKKSRGVREDMRDAGGMLDPSPPVRPILKTATKTGTRTRFIADSDRKYQSYSQSFHYTNYSSSRSTSSASSTPAGGRPGPSSVTISSSRGSRRSSVEMAPLMSAAAVAARSSRERKRSDEVFVSPASDRRVTFSPFTKIKHTPRPRRSVNAQDPQKMASGFVFASGTEMEKRKQAKKKQELQMMEKLYFASRKRSIGWKDMLLENFTILKRVQDWSTRWMDLFNSSSLSALLRKKNAQMLRRRKTRRSIRARREAPQWTEFDQADHEYMKQLTLPASSTESTVNNAIVPNGKHAEFISEKQDPVPDLTPLKQGSFSNLLRKEGIPVDEDEQREKLAMVDDLRGVGHASIRLKVSRH